MKITAPATMLTKSLTLAKSIWADTSGVILPYVTVMLVVIVGVSVLALDGARVMSLQTQLQKSADALALAGAAELDRLPTAITRANAAINNLLTNTTQRGFLGDQNITVQSVRFMSSLPASDATPITAVLCSTSCTADNAVDARFVEVAVAPVSYPTILPASFFWRDQYGHGQGFRSRRLRGCGL